MIRKKIVRSLMLICCIIVFITLFIAYFFSSRENAPKDICNYTVESLDNDIKLSWESPQSSDIDHLELAITSGEIYSQSVILPPNCQEYHFREGNHGQAYRFSLLARYKDGSRGEGFSSKCLFLDYSLFPDLPIISIVTVDGTAPTYEDAVKEDDSWLGASITNNEYVAGTMTFRQDGQNSFISKVKIRVRGNTSSALNIKKSYKIVLDEPLDLLELGNEFADKEWVLLNTGTSLNTYIGEYLAELCGTEWAPRMRFVNVILNNDWRGLYLLIESVKRSNVRCNISPSGYLFENDAYWWNSDGKYFKTDCPYMDFEHELGFTLKYPQMQDVDDPKVLLLKNYMEEFERYLYTGDEHFEEYIDMDSFAAWIMVRDLMGCYDTAGSNMYYYIYDLEPLNPAISPIKIGPLWDFDGSFSEDSETYSGQHSMDAISGLYFSELFKYESFNTVYWAKWDGIKNSLVSEMESVLLDLCSEQGEALEESRILDANRYGYQYPTIESEVHDRIEWFKAKADWMNNMMNAGE